MVQPVGRSTQAVLPSTATLEGPDFPLEGGKSSFTHGRHFRSMRSQARKNKEGRMYQVERAGDGKALSRNEFGFRNKEDRPG